MIEHLGLYLNHLESLFFDDLETLFNPTQLRVVKLKMEGYKNIEIAAKLECCPATITKHLFVIKKVLRKSMHIGRNQDGQQI